MRYIYIRIWPRANKYLITKGIKAQHIRRIPPGKGGKLTEIRVDISAIHGQRPINNNFERQFCGPDGHGTDGWNPFSVEENEADGRRKREGGRRKGTPVQTRFAVCSPRHRGRRGPGGSRRAHGQKFSPFAPAGLYTDLYSLEPGPETRRTATETYYPEEREFFSFAEMRGCLYIPRPSRRIDFRAVRQLSFPSGYVILRDICVFVFD